jgi:hypothetical protein
MEKMKRISCRNGLCRLRVVRRMFGPKREGGEDCVM